MRAVLALSDGQIYFGQSFGSEGKAFGEVVFNTSMTGYQEILTDPSYEGQMVVMTYPEIGNVGVNPDDAESYRPFVKGFIVKEYCAEPSNWRSVQSLGEYMRKHGIVGIEGIDTRSLVQHIREQGSQEGVISTDVDRIDSLVAMAKKSNGLLGQDLVKQVTCKEAYDWQQGVWKRGIGNSQTGKHRWFVVAYDFGIKINILRNLVENGCRVRVIPASTPAEEVLALNSDGIFLSNGPGDPSAVPYAQENVRKLIGKKPVFGICLGHQIIALALGGKTYKLKFGHHGGNQPVMDVNTRKVEITTQNHGFAVDGESLKGDVEVTHINLNDHTVEGLSHRNFPIFSVQYHPESSPGPHDANYLFQKFIAMMENNG